MKIFILIIVIASFLISCSKESDTPPIPAHQIEDTAESIDLMPNRFAVGYDTTNNFITKYEFDATLEYGDNKTFARFIATTNDREKKYYIRYVPAVELFRKDTIIQRTGEHIIFLINSSLVGKPIFEAYEIGTNKLHKRIIANNKTQIYCSFSVWDNNWVTNEQLRDAFNYYLLTKQTNAIGYYSYE